jgi:hypothetical protein
MSRVQPPYLQQISLRNVFELFPFKVYPHHITLNISTHMVIVKCLNLLLDGNCSASVS